MDQEYDIRPGDRIICLNRSDMEKHEKILRQQGIETVPAWERGKPVLVVITKQTAAYIRLKNAYKAVSGSSDPIKKKLAGDLMIAIEALEPGKSNADKIRRMTNEELDMFLMDVAPTDLDGKIHFCKNDPECEEDPENVDQRRCIMCLLKWLEEEDGI